VVDGPDDPTHGRRRPHAKGSEVDPLALGGDVDLDHRERVDAETLERGVRIARDLARGRSDQLGDAYARRRRRHPA
jgi:hypothetical protein